MPDTPINTVNAKPITTGSMRELTLDELAAQVNAVNDAKNRVQRAVNWAVDHEPYASVGQVERVLTALDLAFAQVQEDYDLRLGRRQDRLRHRDGDGVPI
jgi:hypothetical protein